MRNEHRELRRSAPWCRNTIKSINQTVRKEKEKDTHTHSNTSYHPFPFVFPFPCPTLPTAASTKYPSKSHPNAVDFFTSGTPAISRSGQKYLQGVIDEGSFCAGLVGGCGSLLTLGGIGSFAFGGAGTAGPFTASSSPKLACAAVRAARENENSVNGSFILEARKGEEQERFDGTGLPKLGVKFLIEPRPESAYSSELRSRERVEELRRIGSTSWGE